MNLNKKLTSLQARGKVEVDVDAVEKLMVNRDDFLYALENDVKPAHGCSEDILQRWDWSSSTSICEIAFAADILAERV